MSITTSISRLAILAALGATIAAAPVEIVPLEEGFLTTPKAFAKDDDRSDDRDDDRDGDRDDRDDDDHDRDRDDDRDDRDDDRDDPDDRGGEHEDREDRSRGDDDSGRSSRDGRRSRDAHDGSDGIEVRTSDGGRIEIENGRFERKNAAGRTIEERPARASDYTALGLSPQSAAAAGASRRPARTSEREPGRQKIAVGRVIKAERSGESLEVVYSRGWKEEIEQGRYELKDPDNRTVIERPATAADRKRLTDFMR